MGISGPGTCEAESSNLRMGPSIGKRCPAVLGRARRLGLACLLVFLATTGGCRVLVVGGRDEMQVRVENDSVRHVLEALGQNVGLHYRSHRAAERSHRRKFFGFLGIRSVPRSVRPRFCRPLQHAARRLFVVGKRRCCPPASADGRLDRSLKQRLRSPTRTVLASISRQGRRIASARRLVRRPELRYMFRSVNERLLTLGVAAVAPTIRLFWKADPAEKKRLERRLQSVT